MLRVKKTQTRTFTLNRCPANAGWIECLTSVAGPYYPKEVRESNKAARGRKAENAR